MGNLYQVEKEIRKIKNFEEPPEFLLNLEITDDDNDCPIVSFMISGPQETAYDGCVFTVKMIFEDNYKRYAPVVKFVTKCYHPNVDSDNGKVCLNLLSDDWSEKMNISLIIWAIWQLLKEPNSDSPLNRKAAKHFDYNFDKFKSRVLDWAETEFP